MPLKLNSTGGGSVTLDVGSTASNTTLTLPSTSGTVIAGTNGIAPESSGGTGTTTGYYGFKNRIINGDMRIDQRNAGASVTLGFPVDRWASTPSGFTFTMQQNAGVVTPPAGFTNYLGVTSGAANSIVAGSSAWIGQRVEGFNCSDLGWGAANAQPVTLSFWVRSSLTGTFGGSLTNGAGTRSYPFSYTISSANTWEQKSITISGDITGTWLTNNGIGVAIYFQLGVGSTYTGTAGSWAATLYIGTTGAVNPLATNGATFYITGVQLEKGSTATSFDYRPYGTELQLCQRYYEKSYNQSVVPGTAASPFGYVAGKIVSNTVAANENYGQVFFEVNKRNSPTVTTYGYNGASGQVSRYDTGADLGANTGIINANGYTGFNVANGSGTTLSTASFAVIYHWTASAEL